MQKIFLLVASIFGALSVMIGAFGAHALKDYLLKIGKQDVFETAVKYQFYHTFLLMAIGILMYRFTNKWLEYAGYSCIIGMIIFSGSLYLLCATNISKFGAVTPIGGFFLIASWVLVSICVLK